MTARLVIRPAGPGDLTAIVRLHVAVWRETYRDLAPPEALRALDEAARRPRWAAMLAHSGTLVGEVDGRLAGFTQVGPATEPVFGGRAEVKYLYVDGAFARRGFGRALLRAAADLARTLGYRGIALGAVVGNDPAIAFYQAQGGVRIGRYRDPGPIWRSENHVFAWDDLATPTS